MRIKKLSKLLLTILFSKDDLIKYILTTSICFIVDKNYDKDLFLKVIEKLFIKRPAKGAGFLKLKNEQCSERRIICKLYLKVSLIFFT